MGAPTDLFAELSKWRAKATKRGETTTFTSEIIPDWLNAELVAAQERVGPDAFDFLKAPEDTRRRAERQAERRLREAFGEFEEEARDAIEEEREPDYELLSAALLAIFIPLLTRTSTEEMLRLSADIGIVFDPAEMSDHALRWARDYSYDLVRGITDTTRSAISDAVQTYTQTPGMSLDDLAELLEPTFGKVRSDMIAVTETTRAYSEATNEMQQQLQRQGLETTRYWITAADDRVCEICGPLHLRPEDQWTEFPEGPPAHPNCRCDIELRTS